MMNGSREVFVLKFYFWPFLSFFFFLRFFFFLLKIMKKKREFDSSHRFPKCHRRSILFFFLETPVYSTVKINIKRENQSFFTPCKSTLLLNNQTKCSLTAILLSCPTPEKIFNILCLFFLSFRAFFFFPSFFFLWISFKENLFLALQIRRFCAKKKTRKTL